MNRTLGFLALAAVAAAGAAALWWTVWFPVPSGGAAVSAPGPDADATRGAAVRPMPDGARSVDAPTPARAETAAAATVGALDPDAGSERPWQPPLEAGPAWPVARRGGIVTGSATTTTEEPAVPVKLAFRALWYLGVDPEAERTWSRAINDPNLPAGVRSDLIVDMIDEGYTDNNRPGKDDLPVILARLEIIERYRPYAMDDINAKAFEEAYRTLLDLYIRLGGEPRNRR